MITDIPTFNDYADSADNLFNMAWAAATGTVRNFESINDAVGDLGSEQEEAERHYWRKVQPQLANALAMAHQAMELGVKARIAEVSPYLLITSDAREFPNKPQDISFASLRTLDAQDLIRVHNIVSYAPLDQEFATLFEESRVERNKIIHGGKSHTTIEPMTVIRRVVEAHDKLFPDIRWADTRYEAIDKDELWGYGVNDFTVTTLVYEFADVIRLFGPSWIKKHFGFDRRKRAYICPTCHGNMARDTREDMPKLAQIMDEYEALYCFVCDNKNPIQLEDCWDEDCPGNVIYVNHPEALCTTCGDSQVLPPIPAG